MANYKSLLASTALAFCLITSNVGPSPAEPYETNQNKTTEKSISESVSSEIIFCTKDHLINYIQKQAYIYAEHKLTNLPQDHSLTIETDTLKTKLREEILRTDYLIQMFINENYEGSSWVEAAKENQKLKNKTREVQEYLSDVSKEDMPSKHFSTESLDNKLDIYKTLLNNKIDIYKGKAMENNREISSSLDEQINTIGDGVGEFVYQKLRDEYVTKK